MSRFPALGPGRSLVLLLAGVAIGAQLVAPGVTGTSTGGVSPAAIQTRVASCHGLNFHPINTTTEYDYRIDGGLRRVVRRDEGTADDSDGFFLCDPALPDKAVVTKVQFTLIDESAFAEVRYCALYRSTLASGQSSYEPQLMAQVTSTGTAANSGIVRKPTSAISHGTIDNARWGYWLQCQISFPANSVSDRAGIAGATVTYRISAADG